MSDNELTKRLRGADEEIKKRNELINKLQEIVKKAQSGSIITRSEVIKAQNFNELLGGAFSDDVAIVESKVSEEESNKINQWALLHPEKPNLPMTIKEYFKREEFKQVNNTLNKLASGEAVSNEELSKTAELLVDNSEQDLRKKLIEASEKDKEELAKKALSENRELTDDEKEKFKENNRDLAVLYNHSNASELVRKIIGKNSPSKSTKEAISERLSAIRSGLKEYMSKEAIKTEDILNKSAETLFAHIAKSSENKDKDLAEADSIFHKVKVEVKRDNVLDDLAEKNLALAEKKNINTNDEAVNNLKNQKNTSRKAKASSNRDMLAILENSKNSGNEIGNTNHDAPPYLEIPVTPATARNSSSIRR